MRVKEVMQKTNTYKETIDIVTTIEIDRCVLNEMLQIDAFVELGETIAANVVHYLKELKEGKQ